MKVSIIIVHGAGPRAYRIMSQKWVPFIKKSLLSEIEVICPEMPDPFFPRYQAWKEKIQSTLKHIKSPLILIGHSLGGTILLKYLSEEKIPNKILGLYLISSPWFSSDKGWSYQDFYLHKKPDELLRQFPVYSYHSSDDPIVPVDHQGIIASHFPNIVVRTLAGHGHEYKMEEFREIIEDIEQLRHSEYWPGNRSQERPIPLN